jgi:hypothetical protein
MNRPRITRSVRIAWTADLIFADGKEKHLHDWQQPQDAFQAAPCVGSRVTAARIRHRYWNDIRDQQPLLIGELRLRKIQGELRPGTRPVQHNVRAS